MMLFCLENLICSQHMLERKKDSMAEELEKYKQILKREDEEYQEAMKAEVSTSSSSKSIRKSGTLEKHMLLPILHRLL